MTNTDKTTGLKAIKATLAIIAILAIFLTIFDHIIKENQAERKAAISKAIAVAKKEHYVEIQGKPCVIRVELEDTKYKAPMVKATFKVYLLKEGSEARSNVREVEAILSAEDINKGLTATLRQLVEEIDGYVE